MNTTVAITGEGARAITVEGGIPSPSMKENPKYPWGPWQVGYQEKAVEKAAAALMQAQANVEHVRSVVESRAVERARKAEKVPEAVPTLPEPEAKQGPAEVPAAAGETRGSRPEIAAPNPSRTRGVKRSARGGRS